MAITAAQVKELRETSGAGMMDCKKALTETNGDMEKAMEYLREKGIATASKKSGRVASEGLVDVYVDGSVAALVEINIETDFAAKNEEFIAFVKDVAKHIALKNPANVEELAEQTFINDESKLVKEVLIEKIAKIGENMSIRRFERYDITGIVDTYIHGAGRVGVMIEVASADKDNAKAIAHDVALHIAAIAPKYLQRGEVPTAELDKEKEILRAQALNEGKPESIVDKMVQGRVNKFYKEICLLEQEFVKDPDVTIAKLAEKNNLEIIRFIRFEKGEGIQKKEEDFAAEVAKQIK